MVLDIDITFPDRILVLVPGSNNKLGPVFTAAERNGAICMGMKFVEVDIVAAHLLGSATNQSACALVFESNQKGVAESVRELASNIAAVQGDNARELVEHFFNGVALNVQAQRKLFDSQPSTKEGTLAVASA